MYFFQLRCREFIEGIRSTVNVPRPQPPQSPRSNVPSHQPPTDSGRIDLDDRPALPFVGSRVRDSVLVGRKQLGFSLRASTLTAGVRETPGIRVFERVKCRAVQPPGSNRAKSGRSESRFRSGRFVETSGGALGGPNEEEEWSS